MSNRVQVRPSSSNCIISMGKSHGITFKILRRVSVQESPRSSKRIVPTATRKLCKLEGSIQSTNFTQDTGKIGEKTTHTGHSSVQLPCVSYIVFVILFILLQKRFSLAMPGSNKHNSGKLHDK